MRDNRLMKPRLLLLAAAVFLLTCFALPAKDVPSTLIRISVTNQFDKPVENAEVILDYIGGRQVLKGGTKKRVHWEVHTNQEGVAHFPPVPEGKIQIQVNKKTYQTWGKEIDAAGAEQTVDVKLAPPQSQYSAHPALRPADAPKN